MTENDSAEKRKTLDRIIESVGPYGLIAICVGLVINVLQKPLDSNTWVSVIIICSIIGISFLQDRSRTKGAQSLEELRLQSELEMNKHISWIEGNRPLIETSSARGRESMAMTKAFLAIRNLIGDDLKSETLSEEVSSYCEELLDRIEDIERATMMLR
jgi:hypothetical protein